MQNNHNSECPYSPSVAKRWLQMDSQYHWHKDSTDPNEHYRNEGMGKVFFNQQLAYFEAKECLLDSSFQPVTEGLREFIDEERTLLLSQDPKLRFKTLLLPYLTLDQFAELLGIKPKAIKRALFDFPTSPFEKKCGELMTNKVGFYDWASKLPKRALGKSAPYIYRKLFIESNG